MHQSDMGVGDHIRPISSVPSRVTHRRQSSHAIKYLRQQNNRATILFRRRCWSRSRICLLAAFVGVVFFGLSYAPALSFGRLDAVVLSYLHSSAETFALSPDRKPVFEENDELDVTNDPLSSFRPQHQFASLPRRMEKPAFAIGTLVADMAHISGLLDYTYPSLLLASLQPWQWTILVLSDTWADEQKEDPRIQTLHKLSKQDPRIKIIVTEPVISPTKGLNILLGDMVATNAIAAAFLAPYSMVEPTWMEKSAFSLSVVPTWDLVGHFVVSSDGQRGRVIKSGLHSGHQNLEKSETALSTVFRIKAVKGCSFQPRATLEESFWLFWLCFANQKHWGGTLPEIGVWVNSTISLGSTSAPFLLDQSALTRRQTAFPGLNRTGFPQALVDRFVTLENIYWDAPFQNNLLKGQKSVMIVQNWLLVGGSELGILDVLRFLTEAGYRVTMVLTRFKYPEAVELRPVTSQYTTDIHFLPTFLRLDDFPTYIKYLIETRGIETVLMSNSQLIYDVLPGLSEQLPKVNFIDYLHNEGYDGWRNFGFPSYTLVSQRHLARTLTCSQHLKDWLVERGMPADRIGVAKLGINVTRFLPRTEAERSALRPKLPAPVNDNTFVIAWSARIDNQKRPLLVPGIMHQAITMAKARCGMTDLKLLMMGDGYLKEALLSGIRAKGLDDNVFLLGTVDQPETILRAADAFLLPTAMEGISIAVAEAMAIGLPIITSRIGALPELMDVYKPGDKEKGGVLVDLVGNEDIETTKYAEALADLACDPRKRMQMSIEAVSTLQNGFDHDKTLPAFITEFAKAGPIKGSTKSLPNPATYFGLHDIASEIFGEIDLYATQLKLGQALSTDDSPMGMLKKKCLLDTPEGEHWGETLLEGRFCPNTGKASKKWLQKCAMEQCGGWCVWDLRTTKKSGWRWNGDCFTPFTDGDPVSKICGEWFHQRPLMTYLDDGSE